MDKNLTIVTGLWNIGRDGRPFTHYIQHLNHFLEIDANLFLYVPKELENLVWEKRSKENTFVKIYELEDVKNMYSPFWDKTQNIRTNPEWYNQTGEGGWLTQSPQASLEWYNPIVQSKMFLLNDVTIWNPYNFHQFELVCINYNLLALHEMYVLIQEMLSHHLFLATVLVLLVVLHFHKKLLIF